MTLHFRVLGNPVPLGRPRFRVIPLGKKGGKPRFTVQTYPAPSSKKWTDTVRTLAKVQMGDAEPLSGALIATIAVTPGLTAQGKPRKAVGDLDNHIKGILDALNGLAYQDDAQVKRITAYFETPSKNSGVEITLMHHDG